MKLDRGRLNFGLASLSSQPRLHRSPVSLVRPLYELRAKGERETRDPEIKLATRVLVTCSRKEGKLENRRYSRDRRGLFFFNSSVASLIHVTLSVFFSFCFYVRICNLKYNKRTRVGNSYLMSITWLVICTQNRL